MSWQELRIKDDEHEIVTNGISVKIPVEVLISARLVCGHCGRNMEWSYSTDSTGDITIVPICICMGGYDEEEARQDAEES